MVCASFDQHHAADVVCRPPKYCFRPLRAKTAYCSRLVSSLAQLTVQDGDSLSGRTRKSFSRLDPSRYACRSRKGLTMTISFFPPDPRSPPTLWSRGPRYHESSGHQADSSTSRRRTKLARPGDVVSRIRAMVSTHASWQPLLSFNLSTNIPSSNSSEPWSTVDHIADALVFLNITHLFGNATKHVGDKIYANVTRWAEEQTSREADVDSTAKVLNVEAQSIVQDGSKFIDTYDDHR